MHVNNLIKIEKASSLEEAEYLASEVIRKYSNERTIFDLLFTATKEDVISYFLGLRINDTSKLLYEIKKESIIDNFNRISDSIGWIDFYDGCISHEIDLEREEDENFLNFLSLIFSDNSFELFIKELEEEYNTDHIGVYFENFKLNNENNISIKIIFDVYSSLWDYGTVVDATFTYNFRTCNGTEVEDYIKDINTLTYGTFDMLVYENGSLETDIDVFLEDRDDDTYYVVCDCHI